MCFSGRLAYFFLNLSWALRTMVVDCFKNLQRTFLLQYTMKRDRVVLLLSYILAYELRTTFTGPNLESHKTSVHWDHINATASLSFWKRVCSFLWYERDTNFVKWQSISLQCNIYMYHFTQFTRS